MTTTQIFKNKIPNELLFSLLTEISAKNEKYFTFNNIAYKKGIFNGLIVDFIENCKPFYRLSKVRYLEKKQTYNSFMTIIRQICNYNGIIFTSKIKYDKSSYEIEYYIYF